MQIFGVNKNCEYFPCHEGIEDCTFCYCPFYPCLCEEKGKFTVSEKTGEAVWDCSGCVWIHKRSVVEEIYLFLSRNRSVFSGGCRRE
jgi:Zn-finger protein